MTFAEEFADWEKKGGEPARATPSIPKLSTLEPLKPNPDIVSGDLAVKAAPQIKPKSFADEFSRWEKEQETGKPVAQKAVLHDPLSVIKSKGPKSFAEEFEEWDAGNRISVGPTQRKAPLDGFTRKAFAVLGAEENGTVAGIRKLMGKKPMEDYLENTWSNLYKEQGMSDNLFTEALGVVTSIALSPSTYLSFGTGAYAKIAGKVALNSKGLKLATKLSEERLGVKLIEKAKTLGKTVEEIPQSEINKIAQSTWEETQKEVVSKFDNINKVNSNIKVGADVEKLPESIYDYGGIKFAGKSIIRGEKVAEIAEKAGLTKSWDVLVKSKPGQFIGKTFVTNFGIDKNLIEEIETIKRKSNGVFKQEAEWTENLFKKYGIESTEDKKEIFDKFYQATALKVDPSVVLKSEKTNINKFFGDWTKNKGWSDELAKFASLSEDGKIESWFPLIDRQYLDEITKLKLPNETELAKREFNLARKFTPEEYATKKGLYVQDPVTAITARRTQAAMANLQDELYNSVTKKGLGEAKKIGELGGIDAALAKGFVPLPKPALARIRAALAEGKDATKAVKPGETYWVKKEFADQYKQTMGDNSVYVPLLSDFTNIFKSHVTANIAFPSYFFRNFQSNMVQNSMVIGGQAFNPKLWDKATKLSLGKNLDNTIKIATGETLTLKEIMQEAIGEGIISKGSFIADLAGVGLKDPVAQKTWARVLQKLNPLSPDEFFMTKMGRNLGDQVENHAKLVNYMANRSKGLSPKVSAQAATDALFDYSDLTKSENAFKLLIPFYSYSRKATQLVLKTAAARPAAVSSTMRAMRDLGPNQEEWENLPDFIKHKIAIKMGNSLYSGFGLPFEDLMEIAGSSPDELTSRLNPAARYLMERLSGKDFYSKRDLVDVTSAKEFAGILRNKDNPNYPAPLRYTMNKISDWLDLREDSHGRINANPNALHFLRNSFTSRYQSTIGLLGDEEREGYESAVKYFMGYFKLNYDPEMVRNSKNRKAVKEIMDLAAGKTSLKYMRMPILVGGDKEYQKRMNTLSKELMKAETEQERMAIQSEAADLIQEQKESDLNQ